MWSFSHYLSLYFLLPTFATSLALAPPNGDGSLVLTNPSSFSPKLNVSSIAPNNITLLSTASGQTLGDDDEPHVKCESSIYGHPPVASCRDAFSRIPRNPAWFLTNPTFTFGQRGQGDWDYNLPKRFISS